MFRQSPIRNQRSKGFKLKHGLQIFLLIAVCIWLLYQVKHSHDKKKAFDETTTKLSEKIENEQGIIKFGRKDLHPRVEDTIVETEMHVEEEEAEEEERSKHEEDEEERSKHEEDEEEESKHEEEEEKSKHEDEEHKHEEEEEEEEEAESKPEGIDDDRQAVGDDEIDVQDHETSEEEAERGEDFIEEEEKDKEDKDGEMEDVGASDDQDHDSNTQEAREENYNGDDASSAVLRDTQVLSSETDNAILGHRNEGEQENTTEDNLELDNKISGTKKITSDQNNPNKKGVTEEDSESGNSLINVTASKQTHSAQSQTNSSTTELDVQLGGSNRTQSALSPPSFLQNQTEINTSVAKEQKLEAITSTGMASRPSLQNQTENSNTLMGIEQSDSNATSNTTIEKADVVLRDSADSTSNSKVVVSEEMDVKSNVTAGEEDNSASSAVNEKGDKSQNDQTETTGRAEEDGSSVPSTINENADALQSLPVDSTENSISQEEKETQIDLETLPETETEGTNREDTAVE